MMALLLLSLFLKFQTVFRVDILTRHFIRENSKEMGLKEGCERLQEEEDFQEKYL